jgi:hypothetical protein
MTAVHAIIENVTRESPIQVRIRLPPAASPLRRWRPVPRNRGVYYVGHASIGANGDGTWREPSERPYALTASLMAGYGGWMAHEPL